MGPISLSRFRFIHEFSDGSLCGVVTVAVLFFLRVFPVRLFSFMCVSMCSMCIGISISIYVK